MVETQPAADAFEQGWGKAARRLGGFALVVGAGACSAPPTTSEGRTSPGSSGGTAVGVVGSGEQRQGTGTVGLHLLVGPDTYLTSCQWSLSNGQNFYGGFVDLGDGGGAGGVGFVQGGVESGTNYVLTVSATDSNGDPCSGTSAPFSVAAAVENGVSLQVTCVQPMDRQVPADVTPAICVGCEAGAIDATTE